MMGFVIYTSTSHQGEMKIFLQVLNLLFDFKQQNILSKSNNL